MSTATAPTVAPGDARVFTCWGEDMAAYSGQSVTVVRPLDASDPEDSYDEEVGPMFRVRAGDGHEFDAFGDELTEKEGAR